MTDIAVVKSIEDFLWGNDPGLLQRACSLLLEENPALREFTFSVFYDALNGQMESVGNVADEEAEGLVEDYSFTQACGWLRAQMHSTPSRRLVPLIVHANIGKGYVSAAAEGILHTWKSAISQYNKDVLALP
ncbi:MAG: hypothetical protein Q7R96_00165 [Nanoarchaeota archaeon]|nr:hypothetical protein [Nanoarchaeota archaeon]